MKYLKLFENYDDKSKEFKLTHDTVIKPGDLIGWFNPYYPDKSLLPSKDSQELFWTFLGWYYPERGDLEIWIASKKLKMIKILTNYELNEDVIRYKKSKIILNDDITDYKFDRFQKQELIKRLPKLLKEEGSFNSINRNFDSSAYITEINNKLSKYSNKYEYKIFTEDKNFFLRKTGTYKRSQPNWNDLLKLDVEFLLKDNFNILTDKLYDDRFAEYSPDKFPKELTSYQKHELQGERDYSISVYWKLKKI